MFELVQALEIHILIELGISVDFLETSNYSKNSGVTGSGFVALAELGFPNDSASVLGIPEEASSSQSVQQQVSLVDLVVISE